MFEDQTIELLPARTTLQAGWGGNGGRGGRGGDAVAISVAIIIINGDVDDSITAIAGNATATGGAGGAGGDGGDGGDD